MRKWYIVEYCMGEHLFDVFHSHDKNSQEIAILKFREIINSKWAKDLYKWVRIRIVEENDKTPFESVHKVYAIYNFDLH